FAIHDHVHVGDFTVLREHVPEHFRVGSEVQVANVNAHHEHSHAGSRSRTCSTRDKGRRGEPRAMDPTGRSAGPAGDRTSRSPHENGPARVYPGGSKRRRYLLSRKAVSSAVWA